MKNFHNLKLKIKKKQKGFTLVELLIVIAIIGVLSALLMVNFIAVRQRARDAERKSDLRQIQSALELYRSDNGSYPSCDSTSCNFPTTCGSSGSDSTLRVSGSSGYTTYMQTIPCDPSGSSYYNSGEYYYTSSGNTYTLGSCLENEADLTGTSTNPGGTGDCSSNTYYVLNNP